MPRLSTPAARMLLGLDLLLVALVVIAVVVAAHDGAPPWPLVLAGAAVLAVHALGRTAVRSERADLLDGRSAPRPAPLLWMTALGAAWLVFLALSGTALWVAFPIMLLQMHTLGPRLGLVAVLLTTTIAVAHGLLGGLHGWASVGVVLGPLVGAGVAVGTVLGLEALARENAERLRVVTELAEARRLLAESDRARAVTVERERLAREIHDTLAQGFVSVDLMLRAARPQLPDGPAADLVDQAAATARENLTEARRFVRNLAPADLAETTLVDAVRRQVEALPVEGTLHVGGHPVPLPLVTEAALLRITQSTLANVRHHAHASSVDVVLAYDEEHVGLDVVDDGIGFDPSAPSTGQGGYGLRAIASRVAELGGTLRVESPRRDGRPGTRVEVRLPVHAQATARSAS